MPRGGSRAGAGRKRVRLSTACVRVDCGRLFSRKNSQPKRYCSHRCAALCRRGESRGGRVHTPQVCSRCGVEFRSPSKGRRFCGSECSTAWIVETKTNPLKAERLRVARRAASTKRRAAGWKSQKGRWRDVCARDGWACWICRQAIDPCLSHPDRRAGSVDHVVPLSLGGSDADENLRAAHVSCNSRRGAGRFQPKEAA